jgi:hypothetical protein
VKQERKGHAESEAHRRGRGRRCLSAIMPRGERLGGSGVVEGIIRDEEGGGDASGTDKRGTGQKRGTGGGRRLLWRPGGATGRKGRGFPWSVPRGGRGAGKRKGASGAAGDSSGGGVVAQQTRAAGRERLTGGTGRQRGAVGSFWVREGVRESGAAWRGRRPAGPVAQCRPPGF